jgi:acid phosphatase
MGDTIPAGRGRPAPRHLRVLAPIAVLAALVAAWVVPASADSPAGSDTPPAAQLSQPPNVGDAKLAATAYHDSGAYAADLQQVADDARNWITRRVPQVENPAVVFDVDETALSNWPVIQADDYGRFVNGDCELPDGPCGWRAWDLTGQSPAIESTREVFAEAIEQGAAVFFITGRDETQRAATEKNLSDAGYGGYTELVLAPTGVHFASAADFKAPQRAAIEAAGYTVVANVGDQPSDLAGGHAQATFLLPNPFYRIP